MTSTGRVLAAVLMFVPPLLAVSCQERPERPLHPCYTVSELYATGTAVADTAAARAAFEAYAAHLRNTGQSSPDGYRDLLYLRPAGIEQYHGHLYWGIVAVGLPALDPKETGAYRVRDEGTVVFMLGCI